MKPLKDYLRKNYEKSALEQIADDYRDKGYKVETDVREGPYRVDLVATKGYEKIFIELKTGKENPDAKRRIKQMADYFKEIPNAKFLVVVSRFPEPKKIVFEDIERVLLDFFTLEFPSDLDALSTHTRVEDIHGETINEIRIKDGEIYIECSGMVGVTLQYGSDSDQEPGDHPMYMSFPFIFKGTIGYEGGYSVKDCDELDIDTDAYYE